jgi:mannose-6-phosphate isomerase-like protein (cupin superfamily)
MSSNGPPGLVFRSDFVRRILAFSLLATALWMPVAVTSGTALATQAAPAPSPDNWIYVSELGAQAGMASVSPAREELWLNASGRGQWRTVRDGVVLSRRDAVTIPATTLNQFRATANARPPAYRPRGSRSIGEDAAIGVYITVAIGERDTFVLRGDEEAFVDAALLKAARALLAAARTAKTTPADSGALWLQAVAVDPPTDDALKQAGHVLALDRSRPGQTPVLSAAVTFPFSWRRLPAEGLSVTDTVVLGPSRAFAYVASGGRTLQLVVDKEVATPR